MLNPLTILLSFFVIASSALARSSPFDDSYEGLDDEDHIYTRQDHRPMPRPTREQISRDVHKRYSQVLTILHIVGISVNKTFNFFDILRVTPTVSPDLIKEYNLTEAWPHIIQHFSNSRVNVTNKLKTLRPSGSRSLYNGTGPVSNRTGTQNGTQNGTYYRESGLKYPRTHAHLPIGKRDITDNRPLGDDPNTPDKLNPSWNAHRKASARSQMESPNKRKKPKGYGPGSNYQAWLYLNDTTARAVRTQTEPGLSTRDQAIWTPYPIQLPVIGKPPTVGKLYSITDPWVDNVVSAQDLALDLGGAGSAPVTEIGSMTMATSAGEMAKVPWNMVPEMLKRGWRTVPQGDDYADFRFEDGAGRTPGYNGGIRPGESGRATRNAAIEDLESLENFQDGKGKTDFEAFMDKAIQDDISYNSEQEDMIRYEIEQGLDALGPESEVVNSEVESLISVAEQDQMLTKAALRAFNGVAEEAGPAIESAATDMLVTTGLKGIVSELVPVLVDGIMDFAVNVIPIVGQVISIVMQLVGIIQLLIMVIKGLQPVHHRKVHILREDRYWMDSVYDKTKEPMKEFNIDMPDESVLEPFGLGASAKTMLNVLQVVALTTGRYFELPYEAEVTMLEKEHIGMDYFYDIKPTVTIPFNSSFGILVRHNKKK